MDLSTDILNAIDEALRNKLLREATTEEFDAAAELIESIIKEKIASL